MLEHLEIKTSQSTDMNIVLIHGFGASMHDLTSLASEWSLPYHARFLFPNGPIRVDLGFGSHGQAWFKIDVAQFQQHLERGTHKDFSQVRPKGLDEAVSKLDGWMKELELDPAQTVIGGFSQGAMVSLALALESKASFKALVQFSGQIFDEKWVRERLSKQPAIPVFQSHGTKDNVLSFQGAEKLYECFEQSDWSPLWMPFTGGHEIPLSVLRKSEEFLSGI
ncbi:MAG: hypothetical protein COT74_03350 [Bdellovibrionales bacterium CG10_big_fil_rev_8_21_14_0_10_45_34]|nr:MAG: hypothetical protein COT74_03350 [Bdellovibrionales bacterium CG10_big_fil_rev_8_21_14_0_10_45_34]